MVYLTGYGFPLFRGGPMLYADRSACTTSRWRWPAMPRAITAKRGRQRRC